MATYRRLALSLIVCHCIFSIASSDPLVDLGQAASSYDSSSSASTATAPATYPQAVSSHADTARSNAYQHTKASYTSNGQAHSKHPARMGELVEQATVPPTVAAAAAEQLDAQFQQHTALKANVAGAMAGAAGALVGASAGQQGARFLQSTIPAKHSSSSLQLLPTEPQHEQQQEQQQEPSLEQQQQLQAAHDSSSNQTAAGPAAATETPTEPEKAAAAALGSNGSSGDANDEPKSPVARSLLLDSIAQLAEPSEAAESSHASAPAAALLPSLDAGVSGLTSAESNSRAGIAETQDSDGAAVEPTGSQASRVASATVADPDAKAHITATESQQSSSSSSGSTEARITTPTVQQPLPTDAGSIRFSSTAAATQSEEPNVSAASTATEIALQATGSDIEQGTAGTAAAQAQRDPAHTDGSSTAGDAQLLDQSHSSDNQPSAAQHTTQQPLAASEESVEHMQTTTAGAAHTPVASYIQQQKGPQLHPAVEQQDSTGLQALRHHGQVHASGGLRDPVIHSDDEAEQPMHLNPHGSNRKANEDISDTLGHEHQAIKSAAADQQQEEDQQGQQVDRQQQQQDHQQQQVRQQVRQQQQALQQERQERQQVHQQQQEAAELPGGASIVSEHAPAEHQHNDPDHPELEAAANGEDLQGSYSMSTHQLGTQAAVWPAAATATYLQSTPQDNLGFVATEGLQRSRSQQRGTGVVRAAATEKQLTLDEIASVAISRLAAVEESEVEQQQQQLQSAHHQPHQLGFEDTQHEQLVEVRPAAEDGNQEQLSKSTASTHENEQQRQEEVSSDTQADAQEQTAEVTTSGPDAFQMQLAESTATMQADGQQSDSIGASIIPSMQADAEDQEDQETNVRQTPDEEQQAADPVLEQQLQQQVAAEGQQLQDGVHDEITVEPDAGQGPHPQELNAHNIHEEVHDEDYHADQHVQAATQADDNATSAKQQREQATTMQHSQDASHADADASTEHQQTAETGHYAADANDAHAPAGGSAEGGSDAHAVAEEHGDDDPNDPNLFGAHNDHNDSLEAATEAIAAEQAQVLQASQALKAGKAAHLQEPSSNSNGSSASETMQTSLKIAGVGVGTGASDGHHRALYLGLVVLLMLTLAAVAMIAVNGRHSSKSSKSLARKESRVMWWDDSERNSSLIGRTLSAMRGLGGALGRSHRQPLLPLSVSAHAPLLVHDYCADSLPPKARGKRDSSGGVARYSSAAVLSSGRIESESGSQRGYVRPTRSFAKQGL